MSLFNFILFILMLMAIIVVHEFGHFIVAKMFNIYVPEFSIGMGKALYQRKGKETTFSIRLLPIGGYCAIANTPDDFDEKIEVETEKVDVSRTLAGISKFKKILILLAGVIMNGVLALVIMAMVFLSIGQVGVSPSSKVEKVVADSPAENAGLMAGDYIKKLEFDNGYSMTIDTYGDLSDFMSLYKSGDITVTVDRNGDNKTLTLSPGTNDGNTYLGIAFGTYGVEKVTFLSSFKYGFNYLKEMTLLLVTMLLGLFRGVGLDQLSGPVGVYKATSDAINSGAIYYFVLAASLSLNVGIFNLIPIPALDGGRIVLTLIEAIIRRPISKKVESYIIGLSYALFLLLFIYVTGQDLFKLFKLEYYVCKIFDCFSSFDGSSD